MPTSVNASELCINGMSFSQRQSRWANSALVVNIEPADMRRDLEQLKTPPSNQDESDGSADAGYNREYGEGEWGGVLVGLHWQEEMERRAALLGGGNFTVPVQRVTDFLAASEALSAARAGVMGASPPGMVNSLRRTGKGKGKGDGGIESSYRLGVREAPLHLLYPRYVTEALCAALRDFERLMPGFISPGEFIHHTF